MDGIGNDENKKKIEKIRQRRCPCKTRPVTRLPKSRANGQGQVNQAFGQGHMRSNVGSSNVLA